MEEIENEKKLNELLQKNKQSVVMFFAHWCPFCRAFKPLFEKNVQNLKTWKPVLVPIDDESNPLWDNYGIEIVPTVIFFNGKDIVKRLDGKPGVGLKENELLDSFSKLKVS